MRLAVFVGPRGRGSNLLSLYTATQDGRLNAEIVLVVGTRVDAPALERARDCGLRTLVVAPKGDEGVYGERLQAVLADAAVEAIALAGFLRRLPSAVVTEYRHRILNIHPALLPAFGGQGMYGEHVHRAVLAHGAKVSGCTVHFVDETYDTGPIILQRCVPVEEGDTPETLAARILPEEHRAFVDALQLLAMGRLSVEGRVVRVKPAVSDLLNADIVSPQGSDFVKLFPDRAA